MRSSATHAASSAARWTAAATAHAAHGTFPRSTHAVAQRWVELRAVLLLVHAALVIGLVALERGLFDGCFLDVYLLSIKGPGGEWRTMSLGELRDGSWFFPSVDGIDRFAWVAHGLRLLVYASGAVVEAALTLRVARRRAQTFAPTAEGAGGEDAFAGRPDPPSPQAGTGKP